MRIAAVGDSVNWGQGLSVPVNWDKMKNEQKYIYKCIEWLQKEGKVTKVDQEDFLQHSGAIIGNSLQARKGPKFGMSQSEHKEIYKKYYGEIPDSYPTVLGQLHKLKNSKTIDLLFINGGPNDIGITKSAGFDSSFQEALQVVDKFASSRVASLLKEARRLCPTALIMYTGYYPALSSKSDIPLVISALVGINLAPSLSYLMYMYPLGWVIELLKITQTPRLKRQGMIFHKRMLGKFREQVSIHNENRDPNSPPIIFCPSGFGALNTMWAKHEMVSSVDNDPDPEVTSNRTTLCRETSGLFDFVDGAICESAFIGHPNIRGADTYFKALKKRIEHQLKFSLRKHLETIDRETMSVRGLKNTYKFIPIRSIRNLTDVLWLDSISINYTITMDGLDQEILKDRYGKLTTDIPADARSEKPRRFDDPLLNSEIKPLREMFHHTSVLVDFGDSQVLRGAINFNTTHKIKDNFVLDPRGQTKVNLLKHVLIRLPHFFEFLSFSIKFDIRVNGYKFQNLSLNQNSFTKIKDRKTKTTEFLDYNKSI